MKYKPIDIRPGKWAFLLGEELGCGLAMLSSFGAIEGEFVLQAPKENSQG
jgi:hypothetical protein